MRWEDQREGFSPAVLWIVEEIGALLVPVFLLFSVSISVSYLKVGIMISFIASCCSSA